MARLNRNKNNLPVRSRTSWLTVVNTALILGLYAFIVLEKLGWIG